MHFYKVKANQNVSMYSHFFLLVLTHIAAFANESVSDMLQSFKTLANTSLVGKKKKTISVGLICLNKGEGYTKEDSVGCGVSTPLRPQCCISSK